nr:hypothetical protein CFP56_70988 [Quercus suber]
MGLRKLLGGGVFMPTPFLLQFLVHESNSPASFTVDAIEDRQDFFLFTAIRENFGGMREGSQTHRGDTARFMS